jgi:translation initiation factor IF-2
MAARRRRAVCLVPHPAAESVRAVDLSAQALAQVSWSERPRAEVWSADRCAVGCRSEARQPEACHARSARAHQRAAYRRAVSLAEWPSAAWDARALQAEAEEAARASAQRPEEVAVPSAQPVVVAAARAEEEEEAVPHAAGVAEAAEEPALPQVVAEEEAEPVWQRAAEQVVLALPGRQPAARPSAAVPSSRLRPAPVQRPAVTRLAVHAPLCSQIAPLRARWWPAARGEVWS